MDNTVNSCHSHWEKIDGFRSNDEFKRFLEWISEQEKAGYAEKIPVKEPYSGSVLFDEKWYQCKTCGAKWRLVAPDPPFDGIFEPIDLKA
ncbi:MAG: hypothetical protein PVH61_41090 [Candidatus Aminicenantes bacterium]|jgi:hypothetical protein